MALTNANGGINLASGEQGTVEPGKAPIKTASINALNIIQWCLYYPAVLNLDELELTNTSLEASFSAYRSGDLLAALSNYPTNHTPDADAEKIYLSQLLLSVGQVDEAQAQLDSFNLPWPRR